MFAGQGCVDGPVAAIFFSLGKSSLVTPISTFDASPANISNDLFCAFQPKRVMVPSLPFLLKFPFTTPSDVIVPGGEFAIKVASGVASTRPRPNVGVGIRKAIDLAP